MNASLHLLLPSSRFSFSKTKHFLSKFLSFLFSSMQLPIRFWVYVMHSVLYRITFQIHVTKNVSILVLFCRASMWNNQQKVDHGNKVIGHYNLLINWLLYQVLNLKHFFSNCQTLTKWHHRLECKLTHKSNLLQNVQPHNWEIRQETI